MNILGSATRVLLGTAVLGLGAKGAQSLTKAVVRRYPKQAREIGKMTKPVRTAAMFGVGAFLGKRPLRTISNALSLAHAVGARTEKMAHGMMRRAPKTTPKTKTRTLRPLGTGWTREKRRQAGIKGAQKRAQRSGWGLRS
jgi:hypothetical protein